MKGVVKMSNIMLDIIDLLNDSVNPLSAKDISEILGISIVSTRHYLTELKKENRVIQIGSAEHLKYGTSEITRSIGKYKSVNKSDFSTISDANELISYLCNLKKIDNNDLLCQYTNIRAVISIIKSGYWYLGSPLNMNDGLELESSPELKKGVFFSSFMSEKRESIAMWSMYAQPWEDGVKISIPANIIKKWVTDTNIIYNADTSSKQPIMDKFVQINKFKIFISRIAYSTTGANGNIVRLQCGNAKNELLKDISDRSLVGYVKDEAWSYENEIRLRVDLSSDIDFKGVSIKVPEYLINAMTITKGPRFTGDLLEKLEKEVRLSFNVDSSMYFGKLNYTPCDKCSYKLNN